MTPEKACNVREIPCTPGPRPLLLMAMPVVQAVEMRVREAWPPCGLDILKFLHEILILKHGDGNDKASGSAQAPTPLSPRKELGFREPH